MRYIKYTTFNSWWRKHAWSMCWFRGVRITGWWRSIIQFETKWKILLKVCYLNLFFFFLFLVFKAPIEKKAQVPIPCHFSIWLGGYLKQACYFIKSSLVLDILEDSEIWCKRSVTCTHTKDIPKEHRGQPKRAPNGESWNNLGNKRNNDTKWIITLRIKYPRIRTDTIR